MALVSIGKSQFRYSVKVVPAEEDEGELEQLVMVQSNLIPSGRVLRARIPFGFSVTQTTVIDLVRQAQRKGWRAVERGSAFTLDWESVSSEPEKV